MIKNSTDYLAKQAWDMTRKHWKELMLLPILVGIVFIGLQVLNVWIFIGFEQLNSGNFEVSGLSIIISLLLYVAGLGFGIVYSIALLKWCEDVHKGKTELDVKEGLLYGVSRFWGHLGTSLLTWIKVALWSLLLLLPGLYKLVQYSFSMKVSQLEKISGSDANRVSQMLITNSGFIRRIGNWYGMGLVGGIALYIALALEFLLITLLSLIIPIFAIILGGFVIIGTCIFSSLFFIMFNNFHYLAYREENAAELKKMKEALAKA